MQFGFLSGKCNTNVIIIVQQLGGIYIAKNKQLFLALIDLEKSFWLYPKKSNIAGYERYRDFWGEMSAVREIRMNTKTRVRVEDE